MLFSSVSFLYGFLPCVLLLYFLCPKRYRNVVLLAASLAFYFVGEPVYCLLMLAAILEGYLFGLWIQKARGKNSAKLPLVLSTIVSLGLLGFFKYADFLIGMVNDILSGVGVEFHGMAAQIPLLKLALPIGISFYTFQILSYVVDVYRGDAAEKNLLRFAAYVSLFPQLIAGPIVRYSTVRDEMQCVNRENWQDFAAGVERFILGLSKKVLLANSLAECVAATNSAGEETVLLYVLHSIAYMLQVYFDFSGYSDMAIGLGRMFGFHFPENFDHPFMSKSITEFWRRWHMTLGGWFRDYLYIPLGGNRCGKAKWFRNIFIVWCMTGLWHGASWNFVLWGLYFAAFLILEKLILLPLLKKAPAFAHLYTLVVCVVSFVIFEMTDMGQMITMLKGMFGFSGLALSGTMTGYVWASFWRLLVIAVIGATSLPKILWNRLTASCKGGIAQNVMMVVESAGLLVLFLSCTAFLVSGSFNPFLYFRF
jgi:alginate O-acetyltransferase complex protein AlgI